MKSDLRIAIASAAVAALALPTLALGQACAGAEAHRIADVGVPGQGVHRHAPDQAGAEQPRSSSVTESGQRRVGPCRRSTGGSKSGAILLIDASNSMKGAPIKNAMAAARAFLAERKKDLPVAIVVFGPTTTSSRTSRRTRPISRRPSPKTPATSEGTHIYDALIKAATRRRTRDSSERRSSSCRTAPTSEATRRAPKRCRPPPTPTSA